MEMRTVSALHDPTSVFDFLRIYLETFTCHFPSRTFWKLLQPTSIGLDGLCQKQPIRQVLLIVLAWSETLQYLACVKMC